MKKTLLYTLFCVVICLQKLRSENSTDIDSKQPLSFYAYSVMTHVGHLLPTWSFMRQKYSTEGQAFGRFSDFNFQILKQTIGEKPIEQLFHYPKYGMGVYVGQFFKNQYLSKPVGVYGVFIGPLTEMNRLVLNYSIQVGLTGNWNHYDPSRNNFNTTLAGDFTTHVDFGMQLDYEVTPHMEAGIGCSFAHFSNGAMKIPNFGINMLAPQFRLTYLPQHLRKQRIRSALPPCLKQTILDIALVGGVKNLPYPECDLDTAHDFFGFHYPQFALTAVLNRKISHLLSFGLGMHLGYDSSKNAIYQIVNGEVKPDLSFFADNLNVAVISSMEIYFDKVAFVLQPCYTIYKKETSFRKPNFIGKFGLKFVLWDNIYSGVQLHTFKLHADFIEWSLGYRIPFTRQLN